MNPQLRTMPRVGSLTSLSSLQCEALQLLHEAAETAGRLDQEIWQFAVEIDQLHVVGLNNTDLRCLLCLGYVQHAQERTVNGATRRSFQPLSALALPERTCFVVTAKGWSFASEEGAEKRMDFSQHPVGLSEAPASVLEVPCWNAVSRQLWFRGSLIKELHKPACNQETVLAAFEEEGWPMRIDDPLPQTANIDPQTRLHDTIKYLNRHHLRRGICFRGDGHGWGVRWMVTDPQ